MEQTPTECKHNWLLLDNNFGKAQFYCSNCLSITPEIDLLVMRIEEEKRRAGLLEKAEPITEKGQPTPQT
jgi:hypothetical protein